MPLRNVHHATPSTTTQHGHVRVESDTDDSRDSPAPPPLSSTMTPSTQPPPPITPTPLDNKQLAALTIVLMNESICSTMLLPIVGLYIAHLQHASPDSSGYWSGILIGVFQLGQVLSGKLWGRFADIEGRKPALLLGLVCSVFIMLGFGYSQSLWQCVLLRFLHGIFNGNVLVAKTIISDITDKTNEARGFSLVSLSWALGSLLGPTVGGFLYDPTHNQRFLAIGEVLGLHSLMHSPSFEAYPALLPSVIIAFYSVVALVSGALFIKESKPKAPGEEGALPRLVRWLTGSGSRVDSNVEMAVDDDDVDKPTQEQEAGMIVPPTPPSWALPVSNANNNNASTAQNNGSMSTTGGGMPERRPSELESGTLTPAMHSLACTPPTIVELPRALVASTYRRPVSMSCSPEVTSATPTTNNHNGGGHLFPSDRISDVEALFGSVPHILSPPLNAVILPSPSGRSLTDCSPSLHPTPSLVHATVYENSKKSDDDRASLLHHAGGNPISADVNQNGQTAAAAAVSSFGYREAFVEYPRCRSALLLYMVLSAGDIILWETLPLWAVATRKNGGLAFNSPEVGTYILLNSIPVVGTNAMLPRIRAWFNDDAKLWKVCAVTYAFGIAVVPIGSWFDTDAGSFWYLAANSIFRSSTCSVLFSLVFLLIARSVPSPAFSGVVNGIGQSCGCMTRFVIPLIVAPLFAWSISPTRFIQTFPFDHWFVFLLGGLFILASVKIPIHG